MCFGVSMSAFCLKKKKKKEYIYITKHGKKSNEKKNLTDSMATLGLANLRRTEVSYIGRV